MAIFQINCRAQKRDRLLAFWHRGHPRSALIRFRNAGPREGWDHWHRDSRTHAVRARTIPAPDDPAPCKSQLARRNKPPSACVDSSSECRRTDFGARLRSRYANRTCGSGQSEFLLRRTNPTCRQTDFSHGALPLPPFGCSRGTQYTMIRSGSYR